ncbi:MAG TPA: hypothetical protein VF170_03940 [Planctomycetaceae bacterium]
MRHALIPVVGLGLLAASGVLHGVQTGRWRDPEVLSRAAKRLDRMPHEFGDWVAQRQSISGQQLKAAEAAGGIAASYRSRNAESPGTVQVMLLCGPAGPIALHPPTVCFQGTGYRQCSDVKRVDVKDASGRDAGTFFATEFERTADGIPERIRTWWAWTADGRWAAPENPRFLFAGEPVLFKLYLTEQVDPGSDDSAIPKFAGEFLPRLRSDVFGGS